MNKKWIKIVLTASLALNLAFIVSYFSHLEKKKTEKIIDLNASPMILGLSQSQKEQIQSLSREFQIELLQYKQDILEKRINIIENLADPQGENTEIQTKINELNELENRLNGLFIETLVKIGNILDNKQRLDFLYRLSRNWFFIDEKEQSKEKVK